MKRLQFNKGAHYIDGRSKEYNLYNDSAQIQHLVASHFNGDVTIDVNEFYLARKRDNAESLAERKFYNDCLVWCTMARAVIFRINQDTCVEMMRKGGL